MAEIISGKRYAQAIFDLAIENNQVEPWGEDLAVVAQAFSDVEFSALLKHPDMSTAD